MVGYVPVAVQHRKDLRLRLVSKGCSACTAGTHKSGMVWSRNSHIACGSLLPHQMNECRRQPVSRAPLNWLLSFMF